MPAPGSFVCTGGTEFYYDGLPEVRATPRSNLSSAVKSGKSG